MDIFENASRIPSMGIGRLMDSSSRFLAYTVTPYELSIDRFSEVTVLKKCNTKKLKIVHRTDFVCPLKIRLLHWACLMFTCGLVYFTHDFTRDARAFLLTLICSHSEEVSVYLENGNTRAPHDAILIRGDTRFSLCERLLTLPRERILTLLDRVLDDVSNIDGDHFLQVIENARKTRDIRAIVNLLNELPDDAAEEILRILSDGDALPLEDM
ncbi:MAG: hypothetical protein LBC42_01800 [Puniceicoccales bacterium]|jgi:hypothetical protein|nr:hypothetical protein [Puniceicoccales bacterium]